MKHVVITGANRGIGLELARHYKAEGWRVTGACRETSPELEGYAEQVIDGIDVASTDGVERLVAALQGQTIDLLINNAGILHDDVLGSLDIDSLRLQMEVNAFAPLLICEALLPNLHPAARSPISPAAWARSTTTTPAVAMVIVPPRRRSMLLENRWRSI